MPWPSPSVLVAPRFGPDPTTQCPLQPPEAIRWRKWDLLVQMTEPYPQSDSSAHRPALVCVVLCYLAGLTWTDECLCLVASPQVKGQVTCHVMDWASLSKSEAYEVEKRGSKATPT